MTELRQPPFSRDAERCTLGAMLRANRCIPEVQGIVSVDAFYFDAHQKIYRVIDEEAKAGRPVDMAILADILLRRGQVEDVGGAVALADIWESAPTAANAEHYANIVRDRGAARALIHAGTEIARDGYEMKLPAEQMYANAERSLLNVTSSLIGGEPADLPTILSEAFELVDNRRLGKSLGIQTGYPTLDEITGGFQKKELILIAARPSCGKTAFAVNIIANVCRRGESVLFFSLEQSKAEIGMRLTCIESGVDSHKMRTGRISAADQRDMSHAYDRMQPWKLFTDDQRDVTASLICARARRLFNRKKFAMVVVDYVQYIEPEDRGVPRHEQLDIISRRLRCLGKDLDIPIVALAQVRREAEDRADQRPRLRDLKESGALEQNADTVMMLHRVPRDEQTPKALDVIEVLVEKQRNGPTGEVPLAFRRPVMKFEEMANGISY